MSTKLKSGSEKRRLKEKKMLVQAGSDPKQMKLSFSNEINIINVYPRSLNEDKVTVSSEFEKKKDTDRNFEPNLPVPSDQNKYIDNSAEKIENEKCTPETSYIDEESTIQESSSTSIGDGRVQETQDPRLEIKILEDKFDNRRSTLKICDYLRLSPGFYMNDNLIEFYMNYMYCKLSDKDKDRTYVFNTYFYTTLTKPVNNLANPSLSQSEIRHNKVKKWTKNVDIFKKDFIFVPINKYGHWFLAVICFPYLSGKVDMENGTPVSEPDDDPGRYEVPKATPVNSQHDEADPNVEDLRLFDLNYKNCQYKHGANYDTDVEKLKKEKHSLIKRPCILIFDSLYAGNHSALVTATLREWLNEEYCTKYNGEKKDFSVMKACLVRVPQQFNRTDCGLFLMHYFQMFYCKPIVDYTFPISHLENWFHADDVVKNGKKRREIFNIIMERIKVLSYLDGIFL
ncbi:hypothetical protein ACI65C_006637 [Semiaphis heraclei]